MGNTASSSQQAKPPESDDGPSTSGSTSSSCPVASDSTGPVYNVYNQRIDTDGCPVVLDPRNNMPLEPNQRPVAGQKKHISTQRLQSNIPKGGTDTTWVYPSPQMFYNALHRKNKAEDVTEDDMDAVVHAHNSMNEITWARVQQWEALHSCPNVKLRRFLGRPEELSPLARLQSWMGGQLPFDRHDWYVDRCGEEVRYVIDFYFHEEKAGTPEAFTIRARPAIDNAEAVLDRVKMKIYTTCAKYGLPCPVTGHSPSGVAKEPAQSQTPEQSQPA